MPQNPKNVPKNRLQLFNISKMKAFTFCLELLYLKCIDERGRFEWRSVIMTRKAYMIGTGIGNLAAGIYLIRDGGFNGDQITMMGLETHGANDGAPVKDYEDEYSNQALIIRRTKKITFLKEVARLLGKEVNKN